MEAYFLGLVTIWTVIVGYFAAGHLTLAVRRRRARQRLFHQSPARHAASIPARTVPAGSPGRRHDGKRASHRAGAAPSSVRRASRPAGPNTLPPSRGSYIPRPSWDLHRIRLARRATPSATATDP